MYEARETDEHLAEPDITVAELMAAAVAQLARVEAQQTARIAATRREIERGARTMKGLHAELNEAVESNRTLAQSEAASVEQAQEIVRKATDERDTAREKAEQLQTLNATQASMILDRERQIREADERAADLERQIRGLEADLSAEVTRRQSVQVAYREAAAREADARTEGVPKWGRGLTRDQVAAVMTADGPREFISPWLHGRWTVVAILTPNPEDVTASLADIILRPAYGDSEGTWVMSRIAQLQLDRAEF